MPLSLSAFVDRWKIISTTERASAQSHFIDLCSMLGESTPAEADSVGERYAFEKHVSRTSGGKGFADVWLRDHFAWEYKAPGKDLKAAYSQLNDYREALFNPPLLVVCDFDRFEIHTNYGNTSPRIYAFDLTDLGQNRITATCPLPPLEVLHALFRNTDALRPEKTDAFVTQEAARQFAQLAERLEIEHRAHTENPQATKEQIAHFLMRILFCLFADSIGLLPDRVFRRLIDIDRFYPRRFLLKLPNLFHAMSFEDGFFGEHTIPWFNGGLFKDAAVIQLDKADMGILHDAAHKYDWSHVAPAIFGTLFERSLDPARRSLIGAHYTSEEDILLLVEPVVVRPLERRWANVRDSVLAVLNPLDSSTPVVEGSGAPSFPAVPSPDRVGYSRHARTALAHAPTVTVSEASRRTPRSPQSKDAEELSPTPTARTLSPPNSLSLKRSTAPPLIPFNPRAEALLAAWFDELSAIRILDPACGSGNFLYVALRRLLDLWKQGHDFAREHHLNLAIQYAVDKMVSPAQLFGIEIEFYAHELASIVVWIGFLQWKHEHGFQEQNKPILKELLNIEHDNAILRYDLYNNPFEPTWPDAEFIIGNPPFLGDKMMRAELGGTFVTDLRGLYVGRVPGGADLVTYWFEKARQQIASKNTRRAGLLATNSIRMVGNRPVLNRIQETGNIFMAWSDLPWMLDGAAVRISVIAFDNGSESELILNDQRVEMIHADLTAHSNVAGAFPLAENVGLCFLGMMKGGPFDISAEEARKMLNRPLNPNGKPNSDVIKRRLGGQDITGRDRGGWVIDFLRMSIEEASFYEMPFEYVREKVKPGRDTNRDLSMNKTWWLHGRSRPALRKAIQNLSRCIVTPEVAKYRLFTWMNTTVTPDHKLHVIARGDDYFLGVLHSTVHELWTLATCSWIGKGNDPSYNSQTTFDTFPFPWSPGTEPSESEDSRVRCIADAARELVRFRDAWLNPPDTPAEELKKRTLTKLYNQRPTWLSNAHRTLDEAVFAAYGWPNDLGTQEILARLLALNHERAAANPPPPKRTTKLDKRTRKISAVPEPEHQRSSQTSPQSKPEVQT